LTGEAPVSQRRAASDNPPTNAPSEATTGAVLMRMIGYDDDSDTDYKGDDDDCYDDSDDEGDDDNDTYFGRDDTNKADEY